METETFRRSFAFREFFFRKNHYFDNREGTPCHFIGRLNSGFGRLSYHGGELSLHSGDIFYIPKGCRYESFWRGDAIAFDSLAFQYFPEDDHIRYLLQKLPSNDRMHHLFHEIQAVKTVNSRTVGLFYLLLAECLPAMRSEPIDRNAALIHRALAFMENTVSCTAADIARACCVSESSLYEAFRRTLGRTPLEEKHRILSEKAVTLLHATDLSVSEIGDRLGVASMAYFRRILRDFTSKTPSEIRKERKNML